MLIIKNGITIIKRHGLILFLICFKFLILILISIAIYFILNFYPNIFLDIRNYVLIPTLILVLNYAFIKLAIDLIGYNFNVILFIRNKVILLKSTLIMVDDVEIVDISKIMKVDVECRGIIPNILGFGHLTIEQQKNDVRILHYVPSPYEALKVLENHRDMVHSKHPEIRETIINKIKKSGLLRK